MRPLRYLPALLLPLLGDAADWEQLAERGGAYLGAIVAAQEMKKTTCGPHLRISGKWLDLERASAEVVAAFPPVHRAEAKGALGRVEEARAEFAAMYRDPRLAHKCAEAAAQVWRLYDTAYSEWDNKRRQLAR